MKICYCNSCPSFLRPSVRPSMSTTVMDNGANWIASCITAASPFSCSAIDTQWTLCFFVRARPTAMAILPNLSACRQREPSSKYSAGTQTVDTCESPVSPSIRNSWVILAAASAAEGSMDMGIHFPFIHHTCASRIGCHRHNPQHEDPRNYVSILISFQVNHKGSETSATHFRRYTSS